MTIMLPPKKARECADKSFPLDNSFPNGNNYAMQTAGERLKVRLDELGWSQRDLAREVKTSAAVVSRLISGERSPSLDLAFRIQGSAVALPADTWVTHPEADSSPELATDDSGEHPAAVDAKVG
jgi:DNA-binding XRE family transcriptional regulator